MTAVLHKNCKASSLVVPGDDNGGPPARIRAGRRLPARARKSKVAAAWRSRDGGLGGERKAGAGAQSSRGGDTGGGVDSQLDFCRPVGRVPFDFRASKRRGAELSGVMVHGDEVSALVLQASGLAGESIGLMGAVAPQAAAVKVKADAAAKDAQAMAKLIERGYFGMVVDAVLYAYTTPTSKFSLDMNFKMSRTSKWASGGPDPTHDHIKPECSMHELYCSYRLHLSFNSYVMHAHGPRVASAAPPGESFLGLEGQLNHS
ncbi:hypothetical protein C8F04DRAFT_1181711 [Mycena alexandri]|uniref:Uncharacterized protein n=1 Tax=Mycena alexandri TaxID=1745969 RepID=A0AAD6X5E6_9AGAR|nr:hypothetical protein C8F04DRAFT_1181711 [Mycena alexandri]